jgi:hypothetical protein
MTSWRSRMRRDGRAGSRAVEPGPWPGRGTSPRHGPARRHGRGTRKSGLRASGPLAT